MGGGGGGEGANRDGWCTEEEGYKKWKGEASTTEKVKGVRQTQIVSQRFIERY